jgi:hypothetical protein
MVIDTKDLFRSFLWMGIGAIAITALWAVGIVLFGTFTEFQIKAILTTFVLGFYCFTFVATVGEGRVHTALMGVGALITAWGLWLTLPLIWSPVSRYDDNVMKYVFTAVILAVATALGSINFRLASKSVVSIGIMAITNVLVAGVAATFIWLVMRDFTEISENTVRFLIAGCISGVAGTIINLIFAKLKRA